VTLTSGLNAWESSSDGPGEEGSSSERSALKNLDGAEILAGGGSGAMSAEWSFCWKTTVCRRTKVIVRGAD